MPEKIFLGEINDTLLPKDNQKFPILIAGTCVKIIKANENMTIFILNDVTSHITVEIFKDKIPLNKTIDIGKIYMIKGEYTYNYFKEKIIKAYKIREMKLDEEFVFYLEIISERH